MTIFNRVRMMGRRLGLECQRANALTIPERRIVSFLEMNGIDAVVDVGANDGGYASSLYSAGFSGQIFSFEPIPAVCSKLQKKASETTHNWHVLPPTALSDFEGTSKFNVSENLVSSSLLDISKSHIDAQPNSRTSSIIDVPVKPLDSFFNEFKSCKRIFLKIDVQGSEISVLRGSNQLLQSAIVGVQVETSINALYDGQQTSADLHALLSSLDFEIWDIIPGFRHSKTLRLLQYDGIYFKRESEFNVAK